MNDEVGIIHGFVHFLEILLNGVEKVKKLSALGDDRNVGNFVDLFHSGGNVSNKGRKVGLHCGVFNEVLAGLGNKHFVFVIGWSLFG